MEKRDKPEEGPVDISNCLVSIEYRLKKPVFRLTCQNGKEYLFKVSAVEVRAFLENCVPLLFSFVVFFQILTSGRVSILVG